jgi:predicted AAA+ superfamily ATPase
MIAEIELLKSQVASLLIYQNVLKGAIGQHFLHLLTIPGATYQNECEWLQAYGHWFKSLAFHNISWQDYLMTQILKDENPFTKQLETKSLSDLPQSLILAVKHDLKILQDLYHCTGEQLSQWVKIAASLSHPPVPWNEPEKPAAWPPHQSGIRTTLQNTNNWNEMLEDLAAYYQEHGTGIFAEYRAFRWQSGKLIRIAHPDRIQLTELVGYELQRETLVKNTETLLSGLPALNVLLYGTRGTGKSSLVKGLLNQYGNQGLRLIEVTKSDLKELPAIVEQLRDVRQKFIIFVDDLSFEEDDDDFKALKMVLEGNITAKPKNVVVYATSNRRHLVREFFDDRPRPSAEEIHAWDSVQEKLSFSDRFGLTLTFEPANQDKYLTIVHHLAALAQLEISQEELDYQALQWATQHNGRSGRTARQFIDFMIATLTTK